MGAPSKPVTAPKPPRPTNGAPWPKPSPWPPKPRPRPRQIHDLTRARSERDLDKAIAAVQPILARSEAYFRMLGVDPVAAAVSAKAYSIWCGGRMAPMNTLPRKWIM